MFKKVKYDHWNNLRCNKVEESREKMFKRKT